MAQNQHNRSRRGNVKAPVQKTRRYAQRSRQTRQPPPPQSLVRVQAIDPIARSALESRMPLQDPSDFFDALFASGEAFRFRIFAQRPEVFTHIPQSETLSQTDQQVPIEGVIEVFIQPADPLKRLAAKESRLLQDIVRKMNELPQIEWLCGGKTSRKAAFTVHAIAFAVNRAHARAALECFDRASHCAWKKNVVGVQPGGDFAAGGLKSFVDCVSLSAIFFADPGQFARVLGDNGRCFVGRAAIHDDIFDLRIILAENALDRCADKLALVIRRRDDAYEWRLQASPSLAVLKMSRQYLSGYRQL